MNASALGKHFRSNVIGYITSTQAAISDLPVHVLTFE
jgi:hypothetical protein